MAEKIPPQAGKNMCATIAMIHVIANKMESAVPPTSALGDHNADDVIVSDDWK